MKVPVYFRQCQSETEMCDFTFAFVDLHGTAIQNMIFWKEHLLIGLIGDNIRIRPSDGFQTKVCFYDEDEKDYELGAWSSIINLFARIKSEISALSFDEVAKEYFSHRGIDNAKAVMDDRMPCSGWAAPRFFVERGINSFECMFDCENYMRKVLVSERIFEALRANETIFHRAERG